MATPVITVGAPAAGFCLRDIAKLKPKAGAHLSSMESCSMRISSFQSSCLNHPSAQISKHRNKKHLVYAQGLKEQMKQMAEAEKRWESHLKQGKVKSLSAKEAGYAMQLSNYTMLDVRPSVERSKAWAKGSLWFPIYDADKSLDPGTAFTWLSNFVLGGWWSGTSLMKYNERFMPDVVAKVPKNASIIIACQKGLRSLAACELLYKAGYRNLFWLSGGFDSVEEGDLEREGSQPFKFAGIGGLSGFLGWTDIQRASAAKEGLGYRAMLFGRLVALVVVLDSLLLGAQQLYQHMHDVQ